MVRSSHLIFGDRKAEVRGGDFQDGTGTPCQTSAPAHPRRSPASDDTAEQGRSLKMSRASGYQGTEFFPTPINPPRTWLQQLRQDRCGRRNVLPMTHGLEERSAGNSRGTKGESVCQERIGNEESTEVIQGDAAPGPRSGLGAFTDIPNICALARQIKGNPLPCLEA